MTKIPTVREMEELLLRDSKTADLIDGRNAKSKSPDTKLTTDQVRHEVSVFARILINVYCGWPFHNEMLKRKILKTLVDIHRNAKDMTSAELLEQLQPRNAYYRGTAKLTIDDNMEQKLVADFSDAGWYEVTVADLTSDPKFTFDAKGNEIHADWQPRPDTHDGKMENKNIKFYGPTPDNATEAVGLIQYIEDKVSNSDWTFKADITFGGKRD